MQHFQNRYIFGPNKKKGWMATWLQIATDYGIATLIGVALNAVAKRIFPTDIIKGDARWVYYLSIFSQTCIFPPLCFLSWREQNYSVSDWLQAPWSDLPSILFSRAYMASLWGYWVCNVLYIANEGRQRICLFFQTP